MREKGDSGDEVATTPHQSKVYTDVPATRSPILTVLLAIIILSLLTLGALAALHWYQQRSALMMIEQSPTLALINIPACEIANHGRIVDVDFWKADYETVLQ